MGSPYRIKAPKIADPPTGPPAGPDRDQVETFLAMAEERTITPQERSAVRSLRDQFRFLEVLENAKMRALDLLGSLEHIIHRPVVRPRDRTVQSDTDPGTWYRLARRQGEWSCNCPGFTYRLTCKHVDRVRLEDES